MRVHTIYFSPTGGTKKIAAIVADGLSSQYHCIDLIDKTISPTTFGGEDVCILSVPVFGGRVPQIAAEKIKALTANGARAVLIAVFGNRAIDDALAELYDLATAVGFSVIAGIEAVSEHSLAPTIAAGRPNAEDAATLTAFSSTILSKLTANDRSTPALPGNRPYKEQRTAAMTPVVEKTCINCKKCAQECPADAIPHDNIKTVDTTKCFSCMHCVSICPQKARHNAKEVTQAFEERLRDRCSDKKPNRLYL